jgi:GTP-binding protein HflX
MDVVENPALLPNEKPHVMVSALKGQGLEELLHLIQENLPRKTHRITLLIPYDQGGIRSMLHEEGNILSEEFVETGIQITAEVDDALYGRVKSFLQTV